MARVERLDDGAQRAQHGQAVHIRQVDVQQDRLRPQSIDGRQGLGAGVGHVDHVEARHALGKPRWILATITAWSTIGVRTPVTTASALAQPAR